MKTLSNIRVRPLPGWHFYLFAVMFLACLALPPARLAATE
jgi:hypothetical protein